MATNKRVIDLSNSNTFPLVILELVSKFYNMNAEIKETVLKTENDNFDSDFFNQYYSVVQNILDKIGIELVDKTFILYHATMVDNIDAILKEGIKTFDENDYIRYVQSILKKKEINFRRRKNAIAFLKKEYRRKYIFSKQNICFFSTYIGKKTVYTEYCKNIGGELALSAFKDNFSDVLTVLQSGEKIIIKFKTDYISFSQNTKELICKQFFQWASNKYFNFEEHVMEFDGEVIKSVLPEKIIDTILVKNDIV